MQTHAHRDRIVSRILLSASVALFGSAGCATKIDLDPADELQADMEIGSLIRQAQDAWNTGDAEAWTALFADEFVYLPPGAPAVRDPDSLAAAFVSRLDDRRWEVMVLPEDFEVDRDRAVAHLEVRGFSVGAAGDSTVVDGKQLAVFDRTPFGWRIAMLMANENR